MLAGFPPPTSRRATPTSSAGTWAGAATRCQLVFRPIPALSPYRTPVHGLYLASASTFPGGAMHGVCGHVAARQALLDDTLRPLRRLARRR